MEQLEKLRNSIDEIDQKIIRLFEQRLNVALNIAEVKNTKGLSLTDVRREEKIIQKLKSLTNNLVLKDFLSVIYNPIFSTSKAVRLLNTHDQLPFLKIGIIGLGLIGGSIAKTIKAKNKKVFICTLKRKNSNNERALKERLVDKQCETIGELLDTSELIILSTPIQEIKPLSQTIFKNRNTIKSKKIIIDVASVKREISKVFGKLTKGNLQFLPTHPMAGSEKSGFNASSSTLFINHPWIITPHKNNSQEAIEKISSFIKSLGARTKVVDAEKHDQIVARISHLTFLISTLLFEYVNNNGSESLDFAGTGFRTTTRLAAGNPILHSQIVQNNLANVQKELRAFIGFLEKQDLAKMDVDYFTQLKKSWTY